MCGLIYIKRHDDRDAKRTLLYRYQNQKGRGKEGFGFLAINQNKVAAYERAETEEEITKKLDAIESSEILFHHRYPTSTPNFAEAAHPIKISNAKLQYDYYVAHNGIISDDEEWKLRHNREGFVYTTEMVGGWYIGGKFHNQTTKWNDSEAFAIELALDLDANGGGVLVSGSIAFLCLRVDKKTQKTVTLFWGCDTWNPLKYYHMPEIFTAICSEGMGDDCKPHTLYSMNYADGTLVERPYKVGFSEPEPVKTAKYHPTDGSNHTRGISEDEPDMTDEYYVLEADLSKVDDTIERYKRENYDTEALEIDRSLIIDRLRELEDQHDEEEMEYYQNTLKNDILY